MSFSNQLGIQSPTLRPGSSYSSFIIPSSSSSSAGDDDGDSNLPFPTALARCDFLAADFDPAAYLSKLHTGPTARHQTLEDLRAELRERSAAISAELLELVNANYTSFLSLGDELKGGEDRVEDVRVALLGFRRAVEEVQARVRERRTEVGELNGELKDVKEAIETGRRMLELDERVTGLEARLAVTSLGGVRKTSTEDDDVWGDGEDSEEEEDEEEDIADDSGFVGSSPSKLTSLAREYLVIEKLAHAIGEDLPFVKKTEERMIRCRNTILLDLSTAVKEARAAGSTGESRLMGYLKVYRMLDAEDEAVQALKK